MERYAALIRDGEAFLAEKSQHHLLDVMRAKPGETIEIVDQGKVYEASLVSVRPLQVKVVREIPSSTELPVRLFLAFSLLKGGHDEFVLTKGTELGVAVFAPFISARTIIRLSESESEKRLSRFRSIVVGATEQCKRSLIPQVEPIQSFKNSLDIPADRRFIAYEGKSQDAFDFREKLQGLKPNEKILILIGPEGGFTLEEVNLALAKGFLAISLGKRILRAETASLYAASAVAYESEGMKT